MVSHARRNAKPGQTLPKPRLIVVGAPTLAAEQRVKAAPRPHGGSRRSILGALAGTTDRRSPVTKLSSDPGGPIARLEGGGDTGFSDDVARILDDICRDRERNLKAACAAALRLATLLTSGGAAEPASAHAGLVPWQRRKVDQYFKENLPQRIRAQELAEQVSLSVSYFSRAFKRTFGDTPHAHMIRLRLEMAQALMLSTNDPLSQIAVACGFADQSHFSKHFSRRIGQTPSNWRRRNLVDAKI